MADDHQPTLGEVYRLLQAVQASIDRMDSNARADRENAALTFVRKDVLEPNLIAIRDDIVELQKDRDAQETNKRQLWLALAGTVITVVVTVFAQALGFHPGG